MRRGPEAAAVATGFAALISLGAFGADEVRRLGQLHFVRLARAAGADGVELREELLGDAEAELPALAAELAGSGLRVVYSCPEPLWDAAGGFDAPALQRALARARAVGAARLKMSIGGFAQGGAAGLAALQAGLLPAAGEAEVELLIENDQSPEAGGLDVLQGFFAAARQAGLALGMTFDLGNWHWVGECPLQAARALGHALHYVHCKGVQHVGGRWQALPLARSQAPWRAVLRELPADVPWAIEYPLQGPDLLALTRTELELLRAEARRVRQASTPAGFRNLP